MQLSNSVRAKAQDRNPPTEPSGPSPRTRPNPSRPTPLLAPGTARKQKKTETPHPAFQQGGVSLRWARNTGKRNTAKRSAAVGPRCIGKTRFRCQTLFGFFYRAAQQLTRRRGAARSSAFHSAAAASRAAASVRRHGRAASSKRKRAQQMREHDDRLLQRERHADADARTGAERNIGVTVDRVAIGAEKARGVERVRVLPQRAVAMQEIGRDRDRSCRRGCARPRANPRRSPRGSAARRADTAASPPRAPRA